MTDLINGRTPEEIKRWISSRVKCETCPQDGLYGCEYGERTEDCQMCIDALAFIERLEAERDAALAKVPRWISVKERLPDTTDVYLIHMVHRYNKNDGYRRMDVRLFFEDEFKLWQGLPDIYEVTHWMPLPQPPKEE